MSERGGVSPWIVLAKRQAGISNVSEKNMRGTDVLSPMDREVARTGAML